MFKEHIGEQADINPNVRQEEIDSPKQTKTSMLDQVASANVHLDTARVFVTS